MDEDKYMEATDSQIDEFLELEERGKYLGQDIVKFGKEYLKLVKDMNEFMFKYFSNFRKIEPEKLR